MDILYIPPPLPFLSLHPPASLPPSLFPLLFSPSNPRFAEKSSAMDTEPMGKCSWVVWTKKESPDMGCVEGSVGV